MLEGPLPKKQFHKSIDIHSADAWKAPALLRNRPPCTLIMLKPSDEGFTPQARSL